MNTTLRLPEIRNKIIDELNPILSPRGYRTKNKKGEIIFIKKDKTGYFELQFFFNNHFPIDYSTYFFFSIYQNEIQEVRKDFYITALNTDLLDTPNIFFLEGDFIPEMANKPTKYKHDYKNKLVKGEDLELVITKYKNICTDSLILLEQEFSSLEGTNKYIKHHKNTAVEHCFHGGMLETSLIAAKRLSDIDYKNILEFYMDHLTNTEGFGVIGKRVADTLLKLDEYLISKDPYQQ